MILAPIPKNEDLRLQELHSLNVLYELEDIRLSYLSKFTRDTLEVPICGISFVDADCVVIKYGNGLGANELRRDISICGHAICQINNDNPFSRIFEISDIKEDYRFFNNLIVVESLKFRSYMSYVLKSDFGKNIGALFIVDNAPRKFTDINKQMLVLLVSMAENVIHKRHHLDGIKHKFD